MALLGKLHNVYVIGVNVKTTLEKCIEARKGMIPEDELDELYSKWCYISSEEVDEVWDINRK